MKKECPDCGRQMFRRENKKHEEFWGCSGYPDECRKTINIGLKDEYKSQSRKELQ